MHQSVPTLIVGGWTRVPAWNKYPQNCTNVKKPVNRSQANVKTEEKKRGKSSLATYSGLSRNALMSQADDVIN